MLHANLKGIWISVEFFFTIRNFHLVSSRYVLPVMQQSIGILRLLHWVSLPFEASVARIWQLVLGESLQVLQCDHPVSVGPAAFATTTPAATTHLAATSVHFCSQGLAPTDKNASNAYLLTNEDA